MSRDLSPQETRATLLAIRSDLEVKLRDVELALQEQESGWRESGPEQDKLAPQCAQTTRAFVK